MSTCLGFGDNTHNQIANEKKTIYDPVPIPNDIIPSIKRVCCSGETTLILTEDGRVFGLGNSLETHVFGVPMEIFETQIETENDMVIYKNTQQVEDEHADDIIRIPLFVNPPRVQYTAKFIPIDAEYELEPDQQELKLYTYQETEQIIYDRIQPIPQWLFNDEKIKLISMNEKYSLFVTESNRIFGLGKILSVYSLLTGIPMEMKCITEDDTIEFPIGKMIRPPINALITKTSFSYTLQWWNVIQIQAVRGNSLISFLVLLQDGSLYACGDNGMSQLGLFNHSTLPSLTIIPSTCSYKIIRVSMGSFFTLFLTQDGLVYGFGQSKSGQLAHCAPPSHTPKLIPFTEKISMIESYGDRSIAVNQDGTCLYLWGWDTRTNTVIPMKRFQMHEFISSIDLGHYHVAVTDINGNVYTMGLNNKGQLGIGQRYSETKNLEQVFYDSFQRVNYVSCGTCFTMIYRGIGENNAQMTRDILRYRTRLYLFVDSTVYSDIICQHTLL
jgi:alpha-tubulin suppressor-like RCC1 family protein